MDASIEQLIITVHVNGPFVALLVVFPAYPCPPYNMAAKLLCSILNEAQLMFYTALGIINDMLTCIYCQ